MVAVLWCHFCGATFAVPLLRCNQEDRRFGTVLWHWALLADPEHRELQTGITQQPDVIETSSFQCWKAQILHFCGATFAVPLLRCKLSSGI